MGPRVDIGIHGMESDDVQAVYVGDQFFHISAFRSDALVFCCRTLGTTMTHYRTDAFATSKNNFRSTTYSTREPQMRRIVARR